MEKKLESGGIGLKIPCHKAILAMKLTCFLMCCLLFNVQAAVKAQGQTVSLKLEQVSVAEAIRQLKEQTQLDFFFSNKQVDVDRKVSLDLQDIRLDEALKMLLGEGYAYEFLDDVVVIKPVEVKNPEMGVPQEKVTVKGVVRDEKGHPLPGVAILLKGTTIGVATDIDGKYSLQLPSSQSITLVFSFVGMKTQEITYNGQETLNITMTQEANEMNEVVVTGIFKKAKESYTGAVTTVTQKEMKMFKGQNVLATLRNIDPAINWVENNKMGSDPNTLPEINIRGYSSLPVGLDELNAGASAQLNTPLVIMDGFEISLTKLMDFNDEEIESINILKDAAATAIYGSRGANGVIVVTTKSPESGRMKIYASAGFNMEIPDLSSYNLLDSKEKLALEKEAGFFDAPEDLDNDRALKKKYNDIWSEILRGVDTYWLSQPLRTGIGQRYNLRLEGGSDEFRWSISLGQNNIKGAMKGSDRNNFNGAITLSYMYKNVIFKNQLMVDYNKSKNSKYGSFSEYAKMNPYWRVKNDEGEYVKNYTYTKGGVVGNPLYDAQLNIRDESKYNQTTNNFSIEWNMLKGLTLRAALGISKQNNSSDKFLPPSHSDYSETSYQENDNFFRKGKYDYTSGEQSNLNGNLTLSYFKEWKAKHQLYAGFDYFISQTKDVNYSFYAEGFTNDEMDFWGNALQYKEGSKPQGSESTSRQVGFTGNVNYTFNNRYFVDLSYRVDGSSQFGSKKRFAPFWSTGIGWNVHNETFMKERWEFMDKLRLRLSYGETGSVQFSSYDALRMFEYFTTDRYLIFNGADLKGLGNENLEWQITDEWNGGIEVSLWNGLVTGQIDLYSKKTSNLLSSMDVVPSTGFDSYRANIGEVKNTGFEAMLSTYLLRDTERELIWMITGRIVHNKNQITKLSDAIKQQVEEYKAKNMENTQLLSEGDSQATIYAVPSLGIDPSTGRELFLDKNGKITDVWDLAACRNFGDTEPKYRGNINTMFSWQDLTMNLSFAYQWGGQQYNETLLNKVEIVESEIKNNVDNRVFSDRWQKPGDVKPFKAYSDERTKASSRFVMDDNVFQLQAISIQYRWRSKFLQQHLRLQSLDFNLNLSDVFYISSIKRERGTTYPFSRKVNFSVALMF